MQYEIAESVANRNGFLAIYIHHLKDPNQPLDLGPWPPLHALPSGTVCPALVWDPRNLALFRQAIEEAGQRADRLREMDVQTVAATRLRKKNWWE